jgi:hypothetical protein
VGGFFFLRRFWFFLSIFFFFLPCPLGCWPALVVSSGFSFGGIVDDDDQVLGPGTKGFEAMTRMPEPRICGSDSEKKKARLAYV